jgi:hypothetical protein
VTESPPIYDPDDCRLVIVIENALSTLLKNAVSPQLQGRIVWDDVDSSSFPVSLKLDMVTGSLTVVVPVTQFYPGAGEIGLPSGQYCLQLRVRSCAPTSEWSSWLDVEILDGPTSAVYSTSLGVSAQETSTAVIGPYTSAVDIVSATYDVTDVSVAVQDLVDLAGGMGASFVVDNTLTGGSATPYPVMPPYPHLAMAWTVADASSGLCWTMDFTDAPDTAVPCVCAPDLPLRDESICAVNLGIYEALGAPLPDASGQVAFDKLVDLKAPGAHLEYGANKTYRVMCNTAALVRWVLADGSMVDFDDRAYDPIQAPTGVQARLVAGARSASTNEALQVPLVPGDFINPLTVSLELHPVNSAPGPLLGSQIFTFVMDAPEGSDLANWSNYLFQVRVSNDVGSPTPSYSPWVTLIMCIPIEDTLAPACVSRPPYKAFGVGVYDPMGPAPTAPINYAGPQGSLDELTFQPAIYEDGSLNAPNFPYVAAVFRERDLRQPDSHDSSVLPVPDFMLDYVSGPASVMCTWLHTWVTGTSPERTFTVIFQCSTPTFPVGVYRFSDTASDDTQAIVGPFGATAPAYNVIADPNTSTCDVDTPLIIAQTFMLSSNTCQAEVSATNTYCEATNHSLGTLRVPVVDTGGGVYAPIQTVTTQTWANALNNPLPWTAANEKLIAGVLARSNLWLTNENGTVRLSVIVDQNPWSLPYSASSPPRSFNLFVRAWRRLIQVYDMSGWRDVTDDEAVYLVGRYQLTFSDGSPVYGTYVNEIMAPFQPEYAPYAFEIVAPVGVEFWNTPGRFNPATNTFVRSDYAPGSETQTYLAPWLRYKLTDAAGPAFVPLTQAEQESKCGDCAPPENSFEVLQTFVRPLQAGDVIGYLRVRGGASWEGKTFTLLQYDGDGVNESTEELPCQDIIKLDTQNTFPSHTYDEGVSSSIPGWPNNAVLNDVWVPVVLLADPFAADKHLANHCCTIKLVLEDSCCGSHEYIIRLAFSHMLSANVRICTNSEEELSLLSPLCDADCPFLSVCNDGKVELVFQMNGEGFALQTDPDGPCSCDGIAPMSREICLALLMNGEELVLKNADFVMQEDGSSIAYLRGCDGEPSQAVYVKRAWTYAQCSQNVANLPFSPAIIAMDDSGHEVISNGAFTPVLPANNPRLCETVSIVFVTSAMDLTTETSMVIKTFEYIFRQTTRNVEYVFDMVTYLRQLKTFVEQFLYVWASYGSAATFPTIGLSSVLAFKAFVDAFASGLPWVVVHPTVTTMLSLPLSFVTCCEEDPKLSGIRLVVWRGLEAISRGFLDGREYVQPGFVNPNPAHVIGGRRAIAQWQLHQYVVTGGLSNMFAYTQLNETSTVLELIADAAGADSVEAIKTRVVAVKIVPLPLVEGDAYFTREEILNASQTMSSCSADLVTTRGPCMAMVVLTAPLPGQEAVKMVLKEADLLEIPNFVDAVSDPDIVGDLGRQLGAGGGWRIGDGDALRPPPAHCEHHAGVCPRDDERTVAQDALCSDWRVHGGAGGCSSDGLYRGDIGAHGCDDNRAGCQLWRAGDYGGGCSDPRRAQLHLDVCDLYVGG